MWYLVNYSRTRHSFRTTHTQHCNRLIQLKGGTGMVIVAILVSLYAIYTYHNRMRAIEGHQVQLADYYGPFIITTAIIVAVVANIVT